MEDSEKRKVLKIINNRAIEFLDKLKDEYSQNLEDGLIGIGTDKTFLLLKEFSDLKMIIWKMK